MPDSTAPARSSRLPLASILVLMLVVMLPLALYMLPIHSGHASFFVFPDAQEQTWAWWQKMASAREKGYLPLWDANIYSGRSFAGEMQAGVFYPLAWLWLALFSSAGKMPTLALEWLVAVHFSIASASMWLLLRHWRLGIAASALGALCFALFGPVAERAAAQPNIFFGLCWLPLAVHFSSLHVGSGRMQPALLAGAVIAIQVLAGHAQPAFHTAIACATICIACHWQKPLPIARRLSLILGSGLPMLLAVVLLALPQWLLTFQYLADAYRWVGAAQPIGPGEPVPYSVFAGHYTIAPDEFLSLLDPWRVRAADSNTLYLSAAGPLLVAWYMLRQLTGEMPRNPHPMQLPLLLLGAFSAIVVVGDATWFPRILNVLPLAGQIRELGRYSILLHFALCAFAAFGFQALLDRSHRSIAWPGLALAAALSLVLLAAGLAGIGSRQSLLFSGLALGLFAFGCLRPPRQILAIMMAACIFANAHAYRPLALPALTQGAAVDDSFARVALLEAVESEYGAARVIIDDSAGLRKNHADAYRLQVKTGHSATMYKPYFDFLSLDWRLDGRVNDLLNVRYVLTREVLDLPLLKEESGSGLKLYLRPTSFPRAFMLGDVADGNIPPMLPDDFRMHRYDDHHMWFSFSSGARDRIVLSEIAFPGWCATVNGSPVPILRARIRDMDTPLRALDINAGRHEVRMEYRPFRDMLGLCGV